MYHIQYAYDICTLYIYEIPEIPSLVNLYLKGDFPFISAKIWTKLSFNNVQKKHFESSTHTVPLISGSYSCQMIPLNMYWYATNTQKGSAKK